jgi:DtxR family Mn-dependent transcriptional regulator
MTSSEKADLSASLEDYLEAILNLSADDGHAHSKDIAEELGVARPSVTGALRTLKKKGLANYEPYGSVTLTRAGRSAARKVARRHEIIKSFFVDVLAVDADLAQQAACRAEHALGPEVIAKLLNFSQFVSRKSSSADNLIKTFRKFSGRANNGSRT